MRVLTWVRQGHSPARPWDYSFDATNGSPDITFLRGYTNDQAGYHFHYEMTNGYCRPVVASYEIDETNKTIGAIGFVLQQIGFNCNQNYSPDWAGKGGNKILINQRLR